MKYFYSLMLFVLSFSSSAITCSKTPLNVVYINGILTKESTARNTARNIMLLADETLLDQKGIRPISSEFPDGSDPVLYNGKHGPIVDIFIENTYHKIKQYLNGDGYPNSVVDLVLFGLLNSPTAQLLKIIEKYALPNDLIKDIVEEKTTIDGRKVFHVSEFVSKVKPFIESNEKVLLVGHSGGTNYATDMFFQLQNVPTDEKLKKNIIGMTLVAPAVTEKFLNSRGEIVASHLLNFNDLIGPATTFPVNLYIVRPDPNRPDWMYHSIDDIYLNPLVIAQRGFFFGEEKPIPDFFKEEMRNAVDKLVSNSEDCCELGSFGELWQEDEECYNSGDCELGGFIEDTVKLDKKLREQISITENSKICGNVVLNPSGSDEIQIEGGSTIDGTIKIEGDIRISNTIIEARDRTHESEDYSVIKGKVTINDSTVSEGDGTHESARFKIDAENDEIKIENQSALLGSVELKSKTSLNQATMHGKVKAENAQLMFSVFTNDYFGNDSKPGIQIKKNTCTEDLTLEQVVMSDEVSINSCGQLVDVEASGHVSMSGNVFIHGVKLEGDPYSSSSSPMKIEANTSGESGAEGIVLVNDVTIKNRPTLKGDLTVTSSTIEGNGKYTGTGVNHNSYFVSPVLTGGSAPGSPGSRIFKGNNDFKGTYFVDDNLDGVTIDGAFEGMSSNEWATMAVYDDADVKPGATLKGIAGINGLVDAGSKINGYKVGSGNDAIGVAVFTNASVIDNSTVEGAVAIESSSIVSNSTLKGTTINSNNHFMHLFGGFSIYDTSISTMGTMVTGSVNGGSILSHDFFILNATLNNTTVIGNGPFLCGRTYTNRQISGDYNCTEDEDPPKKIALKRQDVVARIRENNKKMREKHNKIMKEVETLRRQVNARHVNL